MFDLEKAISTWRQSLKYNRAFLTEDVDELERHIRDHVDAATARGAPEEKAFREVCSAMGDYAHVESEFRKVYWGSVIRQKKIPDELYWRFAMFLSYLRLAMRNAKRHPGFMFLNVFGLAAGLAVCIVIFLFVQHELAYDQFHTKADRTFRVVMNMNGKRLMTSGALAPALKSEFPDIENAVRISHRWTEVLIRKDDESSYFDTFYFVDSTFFDMFDFRMLVGDRRTALLHPYSVVITDNIAERYFGERDPTGQILNIKGLFDAHDFTITGVVENPEGKSHFPFEFLAPFRTRYTSEPFPESCRSAPVSTRDAIYASFVVFAFAIVLGVVMIALGVVVSVLSGVYPAMILSGFEPARTLKGQNLSGRSNSFLRNGLNDTSWPVSPNRLLSRGGHSTI